MFERDSLQRPDPDQTREESIMHKLWGERIGNEKERPIAARIIVANQGFKLKRGEIAIPRGIFPHRGELRVPDPIFGFAFQKIVRGHETFAQTYVAAYFYIAVHGHEYQAFGTATQGGSTGGTLTP